MAENVKLSINYGIAMIRPEMHARIIPPPPPTPTLFEIVCDYGRTAMIYCSVALLIFGGSYAATKDPEAFARGFISGIVGYMMVRGASR